MSPEHIRWAIRDLLKDPKGPLKGACIPEAISKGKPDAQAVVELLSACGIRRGAKEFFARVLENADEDAELVDQHIGKYGKGINVAAKSLIRIIVINARERKPDTEMESAFFSCINAAETMRRRDSELALSFLEFCGSCAFGSEELKKVCRYCEREEVAETAFSAMKSTGEDSAMGEFFLAVRQVSCRIGEGYEIEGALRFLLEACTIISEKCPDALYPFLYYFCNSDWEGVENGLLYIGLFISPGTLSAFSSIGKDYARIAELADECFNISKAAVNLAEEGEAGVEGIAACFSDAAGKLSASWPGALLPFAQYFLMLLTDNKPEGARMLAENFASAETLDTAGQLKGDLRMQLALMQACYMCALGTRAN